MTTRRPPRFYFSFRSPYSWLAARAIRDRCAANLSSIAYIPFWEPDEITLAGLRALGGEFLYTPMSRAKHLYILEDIRRLTERAGCRNAWPVDVNPWWDLPHLAYLAARPYGKGEEFLEAAYRARWEEGRNICDERTIHEIAIELAMPPELLVGAPQDVAVRRAGAEALYECYRDGVFGVPFFIHGRAKFWGIDRLDAFLRALGAGAAPDGRFGSLQPSGSATDERFACCDMDHAGGCG